MTSLPIDPGRPPLPAPSVQDDDAPTKKGGHSFKDITDTVKNKAGDLKSAVQGSWKKRSDEEKGYIIAAVLCFLVAILLLIIMGALFGPLGVFAAMPLAGVFGSLGAMSIFHVRRKQAERLQGAESAAPKKPESVEISQEEWDKKWKEQHAAKLRMTQAAELVKTQKTVQKTDLHRYEQALNDEKAAYLKQKSEFLALIGDPQELQEVKKKLASQ